MEELRSLIVRAQAGDLSAYDGLVRRFQDMAVGYAYSLLGDFHLAEDAAQEAFIDAYRSLPQLREPVAFPSWFRRVVFKCCDRLTRRTPIETVPLDAVVDIASTQPGPDAVTETREMKERVLEAIQGLPEAEREAITLFYIGENTQTELGAFLGVPLSTVKNRLRSGRLKLKERMLDMAKQTLKAEAPSRDDAFVTVVGLCNAAQAGDIERVEQILKADSDLAKRGIASNNENQAIQFAAQEGHAEVVRVLLKAGADPLKGAYPNREANSALTLARERGHTSVVEVIEAWLSENRGTTSRGEEFTQAARAGDRDRIRSMLDGDPSLINATDRRGQTALFKAIERGDIPLALELLDRGAGADHRDAGRCKPIHRCLKHSWKLPESKYKTYAVMAGLLIARGADYDIWVASGVGDVDGVRRMLETDTSLAEVFRKRDRHTHDYVNPLPVAAFHGHVEIVRLLLDHGADPDAPFDIDVAGETVKQWGIPLWETANRNHYEVAELLLERGANPNTAVYASGQAASAPNLQGNLRIANLLHRYGAWDNLLSYCVTDNLAAIAEAMVRREAADGDTRPPQERLLWSAILAGNVPLVDRCLRLNPKYDHGTWFNLLEQAVRGWRLGDLKINNEGFDRHNYITNLGTLLDHGVDPNLRYHRAGHALLHRVASDWSKGHTVEERIEFARLLLDHGADINAKDNELKSTPLGWAARYGYTKLAEFLLDRGAATNLPDDEPWSTPLAWAEKRGPTEIAEILRERGAEA